MLIKMNPKSFMVLGVLFLPFSLFSQFVFEGPIPPIDSGYGSFGSDSVIHEFFSIAPDSLKECDDTVSGIISYPYNASGALPVVFSFPGGSYRNYGDSDYFKAQNFYQSFVASNGYVAATAQYNSTSGSDEGCAYHWTETLVKNRSNLIDSTRMGMRGYSLGAGIANWLSLTQFNDRNWGSNGRFVWPDAGASFIGWHWDWPDDIYRQTDSGLAAMPDDVIYLMTLHDLDNVADPRCGIDIFNFMGVPDSNKEFYVIKGDTVGNYIYWATHFTQSTYARDSSQFTAFITKHDALDYWFGTRMLHAAMETAWGNDPIARRICLGNGDSLQTLWANGQLRSPVVSDHPWMTSFESWNSGAGYMNPCEVSWNMRQYVTANACFTLDIPEIQEQESIKLFPNPCRIGQNIEIQSNKEISAVEVFNLLGRTVLITDKQTFQLDQSGTYVLGIRYEDGTTTALRFTIL